MTTFIPNRDSDLMFLAGTKAIQKIRNTGLAPDDVKVLAGASGAAKWLVLSSLDRALFGSFFKDRTDPLFAVGTSIGAWRFAALGQKNPVSAIGALEKGYISQIYEGKPTAQDITDEGWRILSGIMKNKEPDDIISHPFLRLNVLANQSHGLMKSEKTVPLGMGIAKTAGLNLLKREQMGRMLSRVLFYDKRDKAPFFNMNGFPITHVPLTSENLPGAVMASGSIPLVMKGVTHIPGAPGGIYRDGGIIDYHLDIPFLGPDSDKITLFPHFIPRIIPGWFDKSLYWRKPQADNMSSVLLVCPSPEFVKRLPLQKIPDRSDFKRFFGDDKGRIEYWWDVVDACQHLGELFMDIIESGRIKNLLLPLDTR